MKRAIINIFLFLSVVCFSYAQSTLDAAIAAAANKIEQDIGSKKQIAILNFISSSSGLSNYVINQLYDTFASHNKLVVTERTRMDAIIAERKVQTSQEVKDDEVRAIGQWLGADYVISGQLDYTGTTYRLRTYAIDIAKGTRIASSSTDLKSNDKQLKYFLAPAKSTISLDGNFFVGVEAGGIWGLGTTANYYSEGNLTDWDTIPNIGFLGTVNVGYAFNRYYEHQNFKLQIGATFFPDNGYYGTDRGYKQTFSYPSLDISLMPYFTSSSYSSDFFFMIGAGPYVSIALSDIKHALGGYYSNPNNSYIIINNPNFGFIGSIGFGYNFDRGKSRLIFDLRYLSDLFPVRVNLANGAEQDILTRRGLALMIGYEFSFD